MYVYRWEDHSSIAVFLYQGMATMHLLECR